MKMHDGVARERVIIMRHAAIERERVEWGIVFGKSFADGSWSKLPWHNIGLYTLL